MIINNKIKKKPKKNRICVYTSHTNVPLYTSPRAIISQKFVAKNVCMAYECTYMCVFGKVTMKMLDHVFNTYFPFISAAPFHREKKTRFFLVTFRFFVDILGVTGNKLDVIVIKL